MEECFFKIKYSDFIIICAGAGVGYYVLGYLIAKICWNLKRGNNNNNEVLMAANVN